MNKGLYIKINRRKYILGLLSLSGQIRGSLSAYLHGTEPSKMLACVQFGTTVVSQRQGDRYA